jgi:nucleotide-binding universal stress UspA family protein
MTILVAATESEEGALALDTAIGEARLREAGLIVANLRLSPLDPSAVPSDIDTKVVERRPRMDVADHVVELLDEQEDIALLVIEMKRRSPVGKLVLGSPAQQLLLRTDIPVLAVKTANRTGGTT